VFLLDASGQSIAYGFNSLPSLNLSLLKGSADSLPTPNSLEQLRQPSVSVAIPGRMDQPLSDLIQITEIKQAGKRIPAYRFLDPDHPENMLIHERLQQGGIGRVLRLQGHFLDQLIDQEYFYTLQPGDSHESLTIFDYAEGTFLKFQYAEDTPVNQPPSLDYNTENPNRHLKKWISPESKLKLNLLKTKWSHFDFSSGQKIVTSIMRMNREFEWILSLLRGPPMRETPQKRSSLLYSLHDLNLSFDSKHSVDLITNPSSVFDSNRGRFISAESLPLLRRAPSNG